MRFHKRNLICWILILFSPIILLAQSKNEIDYIKKLPVFTMFGDNYLITGTSLNKGTFQPRTSDAKFEIGFKQRLTNVGLPFGIFPYISYRQKSFWNVYLESLPFRETNYNPSIGLVKFIVNEKEVTDVFRLAVEHESNGRDEENSRTWNYLSLTYLKPLGKKWQILSKAWLPFAEMEGNEDITSYRGYFYIKTTYRPIKNAFIDLHVQPSFKDELRGFVKLGLSFKISERSNQFLYVQYFGGYSEDLINYNQSVSNLRIGIVFKNLFANFE